MGWIDQTGHKVVSIYLFRQDSDSFEQQIMAQTNIWPWKNERLGFLISKELLKLFTQYWKGNEEKKIKGMIQNCQGLKFLPIIVLSLDMLNCGSRFVIPILSALRNITVYNDMNDFFQFGHLLEGMAELQLDHKNSNAL